MPQQPQFQPWLGELGSPVLGNQRNQPYGQWPGGLNMSSQQGYTGGFWNQPTGMPHGIGPAHNPSGQSFGSGNTVNPRDLMRQTPHSRPGRAFPPSATNTRGQGEDQAEEGEQEE